VLVLLTLLGEGFYLAPPVAGLIAWFCQIGVWARLGRCSWVPDAPDCRPPL